MINIYNSVLQSNNSQLQSILDDVGNLSVVGSGDNIMKQALQRDFKELNISDANNIGAYAFADCSSLTTISFPACTRIGVAAFSRCYSLKNVDFPACTSIGAYAFANCSSLTTISFPACTYIGDYAFIRCYNLKSLYLTGSKLCALYNSSIFTSTPIGGYSASAGTYGSIYVPTSLLTSYKNATNWTYFSSRFVGI